MQDGKLFATQRYERAPSAAGSETSEAAAAQIDPLKGTLRREILLNIVRAGDHGRTREQIAEQTMIRLATVCPRILELERAGVVERTGQTRPTRSGRQAEIWRATVDGRAAVELIGK